jgi:hypothetical protein
MTDTNCKISGDVLRDLKGAYSYCPYMAAFKSGFYSWYSLHNNGRPTSEFMGVSIMKRKYLYAR